MRLSTSFPQQREVALGSPPFDHPVKAIHKQHMVKNLQLTFFFSVITVSVYFTDNTHTHTPHTPALRVFSTRHSFTLSSSVHHSPSSPQPLHIGPLAPHRSGVVARVTKFKSLSCSFSLSFHPPPPQPLTAGDGSSARDGGKYAAG